jgi:hypothetical protein
MSCRHYLVGLACALSLLAFGCFKSNKIPGLETPADPRPRKRDAGVAAGSNSPDGPVSGSGSPTDPGSPDGPDAVSGRCVRGGYCAEVETEVIDTADLLFVVDDSGSMRQEQSALRDQFPHLISTLTLGATSAGETFPPFRDLHLGVVSTDMGLAGIPNNFPGCNTQRHINGGDDGVLLHPGATLPGCASSYPQFLSFVGGQNDPAQLANDFGCIAALGTAGCGFEQPLEAALKALWPKTYVDAQGNVYPPEKNPILFLSTTAEGRFGHGDIPPEQGGNGGFARDESLLAIVVVTDEEDCSSKSTAHFVSTNDPNNPLSKQGINLRCFYNKQNLFELDRYVMGFEALRPGRERSVVFAAIAGIPVELVSAEARAAVNFADPESRDAYYDRILQDTRMQERPQNENVPAIANVAPSCTRTDRNGERADAYPPRRIVEVAKGLGENTTVQSICQDDFGPAMDAIIDVARARTQLKCLEQPLQRGSNGKVDCDVLWELPSGDGVGDAPTSCSERPFLSDVKAPRTKRSQNGGRVCAVAQLAVTSVSVPGGNGFYYDDFSNERKDQCRRDAAARIAFTAGAKVPAGVRAFVDCSTRARE